MKKVFCFVLAIIMAVALFVPSALAVEDDSYSLSRTTVYLDSAGRGSFTVTVNPGAAYGGAKIELDLSGFGIPISENTRPMDIFNSFNVRFSISGLAPAPTLRSDGLLMLAIGSESNVYSGTLTCIVEFTCKPLANDVEMPMTVAIGTLTGLTGKDDQKIIYIPITPTDGEDVITLTPYNAVWSVNSVSVTPGLCSVQSGATQQFTATVSATGGAPTTVDWSLSGNKNAGTTISNTGLLTVAADETADTLRVTATSECDPTKQGNATVHVDAPPIAVNSVLVSPASAIVQRGGAAQQFTARVDVTGSAPTSVTWRVTGNTSAGTTISNNGLLTVAADEDADNLNVFATSTADSNKYGSALVTVTSEIPPIVSVNSVTVSPGTANVQQGATRQFTANVSATGGASTAVTWSVSGNANSGTLISTTGLLTVASGETATTLTVTATSTHDFTKSGAATVTVTAGGPLPVGNSGGGGNDRTPAAPPAGETIPDVEVPLDEGPVFPFEDVLESHWFYGDVYYMWENELMNGTSDTLFSPYGTLTRAMVVTVLYRMDGSPDVSDLDMPFSDVAAGLWYYDAIKWAADNGIALGVGEGIFLPGDNVTREQMAAFICRYADYTETEIPELIEYADFADEKDISGFATEYVKALYMAEVIRGKENNRFDPKGSANRAEFAAVLHRYLTMESPPASPPEQ